MQKYSEVLKKKIIEELDHLEYLEHRNINQRHLKKKKFSKEKHHLGDPLHPGIKLFFLVYVILVIILVTMLQNVEPMSRTESTMNNIQTKVILESHMKH
jgi:hypothetical protein